jgi:hypothetical protein
VLFAAWWEENTGQAVPELLDDGQTLPYSQLHRRTRPKRPKDPREDRRWTDDGVLGWPISHGDFERWGPREILAVRPHDGEDSARVHPPGLGPRGDGGAVGRSAPAWTLRSPGEGSVTKEPGPPGCEPKRREGAKTDGGCGPRRRIDAPLERVAV